jgi:hypothetical protein
VLHIVLMIEARWNILFKRKTIDIFNKFKTRQNALEKQKPSVLRIVKIDSIERTYFHHFRPPIILMCVLEVFMGFRWYCRESTTDMNIIFATGISEDVMNKSICAWSSVLQLFRSRTRFKPGHGRPTLKKSQIIQIASIYIVRV